MSMKCKSLYFSRNACYSTFFILYVNMLCFQYALVDSIGLA